MAVRNFESPDGTAWTAWDVVPGHVSDFHSTAGSHLPPQMADGWLCFESGREKRRLAPLPANWAERSDAELWFLCRAAEPVRPRAPRVSDPPPEDDGEPAAAIFAGQGAAAGV